MKQISFIAAAIAAAAIAMPASADERGHGRYNSKPAVDLSAQLLSKSKHGGSVANVDANVRGVADVDLDVLSKSKGKGSILDLNATLGKGKGQIAGIDLDISKRKGIDLDVTLGGKNRGRGGHDYDFGGGVGY